MCEARRAGRSSPRWKGLILHQGAVHRGVSRGAPESLCQRHGEAASGTPISLRALTWWFSGYWGWTRRETGPGVTAYRPGPCLSLHFGSTEAPCRPGRGCGGAGWLLLTWAQSQAGYLAGTRDRVPISPEAAAAPASLDLIPWVLPCVLTHRPMHGLPRQASGTGILPQRASQVPRAALKTQQRIQY